MRTFNKLEWNESKKKAVTADQLKEQTILLNQVCFRIQQIDGVINRKIKRFGITTPKY